MSEVEPCFKAPRPKRAKGRARPDEPLAARCEICGFRWATCRHHKLRRSQGGGDEPANTMDLCLFCHEEVHVKTGRSYLLGYLIRSGAVTDHMEDRA